jgi:acetyltransferase
MQRLIDHARARGTGRLVGLVLRENTGMLALARSMGFQVQPEAPDEPAGGGVLRVTLDLAG